MEGAANKKINEDLALFMRMFDGSLKQSDCNGWERQSSMSAPFGMTFKIRGILAEPEQIYLQKG